MNSNSLLYALNDVDPKLIRSAEPGRQRRAAAICCFAAFALIAAAVLVFVGVGTKNRFPAARVYVDVNPCFALDVSRSGKILALSAENGDAEKVLSENRALADEKLITIGDLLDGIMSSGFLSEEKDTILLSIDCAKADLADKLCIDLANDAGAFLAERLPTGHAITLSLSENKRADSIAENYGISIGKASFLIRLIGLEEEYTAEKLAALDVTKLRKLCEENNIGTERTVMVTEAEAYETACAVLKEVFGEDSEGGTVYGFAETETSGFWRIVVQGEKSIAACDIDGETGDVIRELHSLLLTREQALDAAIAGAGLSSRDVSHYDFIKTEEWIWRYVSMPAFSDSETRAFLDNELDLTRAAAYTVTVHTADGLFYSVKINGITGEAAQAKRKNYSYRIDTLDAVVIAMEDAGIEREIPDPTHISCLILNGICDLEFECGGCRYSYRLDAYTGEVLSRSAAGTAP